MTVIDQPIADIGIVDLADHEFEVPCEAVELHPQIGEGLPASWIMRISMTKDCDCGAEMVVLVCDNCKTFYTTTSHGACCACGKTTVYPFRKIILSVEPLK